MKVFAWLRILIFASLFCGSQDESVAASLKGNISVHSADKVSTPGNPSFIKARRVTTVNTTCKPYIFFDRDCGYIFTSLSQLSENEDHSLRNKKFRYFKKGIPGKKILVTPLSYIIRVLYDHTPAALQLREDPGTLAYLHSPDLRSALNDRFEGADPILTI